MNAKQQKQTELIISKDADDFHEDSTICCMEGPAYGAPVQPSVDGHCATCRKPIHWAATAPPKLKKICRACTLRAIESGLDYPLLLAVTETTIKEVLEQLGVTDTPEVRAHITSMAKSNYIKWLRDAVLEEEAHDETNK